jgi:hypothetical protein
MNITKGAQLVLDQISSKGKEIAKSEIKNLLSDINSSYNKDIFEYLTKNQRLLQILRRLVLILLFFVY